MCTIYQDLPTGHHLRLLSLQKPPEETFWKVLVDVFTLVQRFSSTNLSMGGLRVCEPETMRVWS